MKLSELGKTIRKFRIDAGVNQRQMAEELGVTNSYLSMIEKGDKDASQRFTGKMESYFESKGIHVGSSLNEAYMKSIKVLKIDLQGKSPEVIKMLFTIINEAEMYVTSKWEECAIPLKKGE
ncbi:helix-turn-helix domain-containing protein [Rosenbergiella metrosideri]|uniref:helix-turn-helix domain-containing protein n=1 Tax=Rosenbergiella metrosideri TaxID=2921185 RepID=UPI001F4FAF15|nr:helix-turn-helix transcriptional regulator [Rosenbergiella metrosideri]